MGQEVLSRPHDEAFSLGEETMDLARRIREGTNDFEPGARKSVEKALGLALELHRDQKLRKDGTQAIDHILRVGNRVLNSFGVTDPDVIIAAFLHDSVEDQSKKLSEKWWNGHVSHETAALLYLSSEFGPRAATIIKALTKPNKADYANLKDRDRDYLAQLKEDLRTPATFYVKLADFYDNTIGLMNITNAEKRKQLARKYQKVVNLFLKRLKKNDVTIPPSTEFLEGKASVVAKLREAEKVIADILLQ